MRRSLFLIFNHEVTEAQKKDAGNSLDIGRVVHLPDELKQLWQQIPSDLDSIGSYLVPLKNWLVQKSIKGDYVLIQGDFGACYLMVNLAFDLGLIPIYSTTQREAVEEYNGDGSVKLVHQFKHRIFRKYGV
ncbi:MAG: CRISPR-associated protein Csx20 [Thermodesulfobacteriota bacterium]|nr:CRISPR-associated protein Csx20 [Thermodesulfobacteriota bacterium]